ncbi:MAG: O-antigen ligase family protein [Bacillota bacterium]
MSLVFLMLSLVKTVLTRSGLSVILNIFIITKRKWLFILIPLLPLTSLWLGKYIISNELLFINAYLEFIILYCLFIITIKEKRLDKQQKGLIILPLLAIPGLIYTATTNTGHFLSSLFLILLLIFSVGIYDYFRKNIKIYEYIDLAALLWIILNILDKSYIAQAYNRDIIYVRDGGVWASNHVAMVLMLLLPLIKKQSIKIAIYIILLLTFSRGVYLAMIIYLIAWWIFVNKQKAISQAIIIVVIITSVYILAPTSFINQSSNFFVERFGIENQALTISSMSERVAIDPRWELQKQALEISKKSWYFGTGLGGFAWELEQNGYLFRYSNAHNLYLTLLAEGGIPFFVGIMIFLFILLRLSYRLSRPIFVGIICFLVYGFYSGQIYETAGTVTAMDYYYLLFIYAYLTHLNELNKTCGIKKALQLPA